MKNMTAKECKNINDHPLDFDLFWDLIAVAVPALDGKLKAIKPKFLKSKEQPIGFPDTPEWHAFMAVMRECLQRFPCKQPCECHYSDSDAARQKANRRLQSGKGAQTAERFMARYMGVWHTYSTGLLKEYDRSKKSPTKSSFRRPCSLPPRFRRCAATGPSSQSNSSPTSASAKRDSGEPRKKTRKMLGQSGLPRAKANPAPESLRLEPIAEKTEDTRQGAF